MNIVREVCDMAKYSNFIIVVVPELQANILLFFTHSTYSPMFLGSFSLNNLDGMEIGYCLWGADQNAFGVP